MMWKPQRRDPSGLHSHWFFSPEKPEYTLEIHSECPCEVKQYSVERKIKETPEGQMLNPYSGCVWTMQLKFYNQKTDILIDTYEVFASSTDRLQSEGWRHGVVPKNLGEGGVVEVWLITAENCHLATYRIDEQSKIIPKSEVVDCEDLKTSNEKLWMPGPERKSN